MSIESFTIISLGEPSDVKKMAECLGTVCHKYYYDRCIAAIELIFREAFLQRANHEIDRLPVKFTYYDQIRKQFIDEGRILISTEYFDFTIYRESSNCIQIKKHPQNSSEDLPFEEGDATSICEGLRRHFIKFPETLEIDLIKNITEGKKSQVVNTVSYPIEEGLKANIAEIVNHSIWSLFHKTK